MQIKSWLHSFTFLNLSAILIGFTIGKLWGPISANWSLLSWIPVTLIKALATPLLFFSVLHGFLSEQIRASGFRTMVIICTSNAVMAIGIAFAVTTLFDIRGSLEPLISTISSSTATEKGPKVLSFVDISKSFIPESLIGPFVSNQITMILFLSLLLGYALRLMHRDKPQFKHQLDLFRSGLDFCLEWTITLMGFVLKLMPIAILVSVAKAVGDRGASALTGLVQYAALCILGLLLQVLIVYQGWILLRVKLSLKTFWQYAKTPMIHAFGVNSSLAALPSTLHALDELKCSKGSSRMGACIGTSLNNDGILLYEVVAIFLLAQAYGVDWTLTQKFFIAGTCILATLGVSGFPEAGVMALSVVLSNAHLPLELLPLLLPVDWLIARLRSATNTVSDMTVSLAIDSFEKKVY